MTIEQNRRELFEVALRRDWAAHLVVLDREGDGYVFGDIDSAWWAFNAALDAVVIHLPETYRVGAIKCDAHQGTLIACRTAIESADLGLKVLP